MIIERNTKQKQTVYDALKTLGHPSATEVYEYVHAAHPSISRGTVFRVLGGFVESGKAKRLSLSGSDERFDATVVPHAHTRCRICGKIADIALPHGCASCGMCGDFRAETCEVVFSGVCAECGR